MCDFLFELSQIRADIVDSLFGGDIAESVAGFLQNEIFIDILGCPP